MKTDDFPADVDVKRFFDKMPGSISIFKDDESDNKECVMLSPQSIENSVTASKIANMFSNLESITQLNLINFGSLNSFKFASSIIVD